MIKLNVLYPQPTNTEQFDADYKKHLQLFHEKTGIPLTEKPYSLTKFLSSPEGPAAYYQLFSMPFESIEAVKETLQSKEMQVVAADAFRISTGGNPIIMIGDEH